MRYGTNRDEAGGNYLPQYRHVCSRAELEENSACLFAVSYQLAFHNFGKFKNHVCSVDIIYRIAIRRNPGCKGLRLIFVNIN